MLHPWPPPETATHATDPRIDEARKQIDAINRVIPSLSRIHHLVADGPEECYGLFEQSFTSELFTLRLRVPEFASWLLEADMHVAYGEYRRLLQYLSWRSPGERWVLKAPMHLLYLETLLDTFPDACIVQTHRDPIEALPSLCSLQAIVRELFLEVVDFGQVGQALAERLLVRTHARDWRRAKARPRPVLRRPL